MHGTLLNTTNRPPIHRVPYVPVFFNRLQDATEMIKVLFGCLRLNVKDVNKQFDTTKDRFSVPFKVTFVECILTTTIPQIEDQVAQEPNMMVFHVQRGGKTGRISCQVIGKDDTVFSLL